MKPGGIGIVGAGVAGLHLGLFLLKHGIHASIYTDRSSKHILNGPLIMPSPRFVYTRERERELGVDFWDGGTTNLEAIHISVRGDKTASFQGGLAQPASNVDMRVYLARLLDEFHDRGGWVVIGTMQAGDVADLSEEHQLVVVSTGRGPLAEMFPRIPERSPFGAPQRVVCAGIYRGIGEREGRERGSEGMGRGIHITIVPGVGEVMLMPSLTLEGMASSLIWEAVPGGPFEELAALHYKDDPAKYEATVCALLSEYAPEISEEISHDQFGIIGPHDVVHQSITPVVRRGFARLGNDRCAVAIGEACIMHDPINLCGIDLAAYSARALGEAILEGRSFDDNFCEQVEARNWDYCRPNFELSTSYLLNPSLIGEWAGFLWRDLLAS